jgi:hypothetical protein
VYGHDGGVASDDGDAGNAEAARQAGAHVDGLLVEVARHVAEACEERAVRVGRGQALAGRERAQKKVSLLNGVS